jgi:hypothetical protein
MMKKLALLLVINFISFSAFSQSLTNKTVEELEAMKKEAISSENYDLANKITEEQKTRVSIDDKLKELDKSLKVAVANENFDEAEKLKNEIKKLEEKKVAINKLEEEKKAAILVEDFDKVIALDKQINDLKSDRKPTPSPINNLPNTQQASQIIPSSGNTLSVGGGAFGDILNMAVSVNSPPPTNNSTAIIFPTELSPNGDGINDFLVFKNLDISKKNQLFIFKKNKKTMVFAHGFYKNDWAGKKNLESDEYIYSLLVLLPPGSKKKWERIEGTFNYIK